jgi:acetylornithine deacetylase/succinyl-diaminopimelate desuccinylase-like protein
MHHSKYLSFVAFIIMFATAAAQPDPNLTREIFKEMIEINTTHSTGSTTKAAEAVAARLKAAGFTDADIFLGGAAENKGNIVARLKGSEKSKRRPLLLLAHLDVVEAPRVDWSTDPFKFEEIDGFYYARGSSDDKAMASIFVANMVRMKKENFTPDRDIIMALTADEEGGEHNGVKWLLENHKDLIDAEFALNEGGRGQEKEGKKILNQVQVSEKVYQSYTLTVVNRGGHSSQPRKDNAIYRLAHALDNLSKFDFPLDLNEGTRVYFEKSSKIETGQLAADMAEIVKPNYDPEALKRLSVFPNYNAMLRTTCVATTISGGHADNALPQQATANVNCRILPGEDPTLIKETLIKVIDDKSVTITAKNDANASPPSALNAEVFGPIEKITQKMWPNVPVVPTMSTGATDGALLRNAGIPTYGVCGIFGDVTDSRAHGKDERVGVKAYYEGQEFLYQLVKEMSQKTTVKRNY